MISKTQFNTSQTPNNKFINKKVKFKSYNIKQNKHYQSKSKLDLIIEDQINKNKYDYKKMMDDFDIETRRKKMINGIKNKWQEISKGYMEKIEEMKLKNEKLYKERNKKFKQKIKKKELAIKNQIELKNQKLLEKKKEQEEYSKKKMDDVLKNLKEYNKTEEQKRLRLEQETFEKSN